MVGICLNFLPLKADPVVTKFTNNFESFEIVVAADNENNAVAVLSDGGTIKASYLTNGGPWGPLVDLSAANNYSSPSVAMDATGTAIAMWAVSDSPSEIQTAYLTGGVWTTPSPQPLDTITDYNATSVAMNGLGQGVGAWSTGTGINASFFSGGTWTAVTPIGSTTSTASITTSYSPGGNASALWSDFDLDINDLYANTYNGSLWAGEVILDTDLQGYPDAGIDAAGNTIAIWSTRANNIVSSRFDGSKWSTPQTLSVASGNTDAPSIAVDDDGSAIAVWRDSGNNLQMIRFNGSAWGTPSTIATGLNSYLGLAQPTIRMNDNGDALIGWFSSTNEIINALLPKIGVLKTPGVITTTTDVIRLKLALSSTFGFDVWNESNDFSDTFGSYNEFVTLNDVGDCYSENSATGELLAVESSMISQLKFSYNSNTYSADTSTTGSATITYDSGFAIMKTLGLGSATIASKIRAYAPSGQGVSCIFTATFFNGDENTKGIAGLGNDTDGFFFGSIEGIFGILHRDNSINTFIAQADWNVDKMDGTGPSGIVLDTTFGNVYKIQYQRLEFGNIYFYIESADTGQFILVNQIQYTNNNTAPSLSNPGLQLMAQVSSDGGDIYMELGSMGLYIEGEPNYYIGIRNMVSANSGFDTTNASFISVRNDPVFSSITNQLMVIPDELSLLVGSDSANDAVFSLYLNPILDGSPTFTQVNPNSCVSYSTEGFPVLGGTLIGRFVLAPGSEAAIYIGNFGIQLSPGDIMVIASFILKPGVGTLHASTSWLEQF